jgi:mRNA interferase MazF
MHSPGDILLVPLPFTDLSSTKRRPVLVLSKKEYNDAADDVIVAGITSNPEKKPYSVQITNSEMAEGVLAADSFVRADKIYTLSQNIVVKRFGKVKPDIVGKVKGSVINLIG